MLDLKYPDKSKKCKSDQEIDKVAGFLKLYAIF